MLEQVDMHMPKKKKNPNTDIIPFTKIYSKWFTVLNVKHKTIKLLKGNMRENQNDSGYSDDFLDTTPKAWIHERIN